MVINTAKKYFFFLAAISGICSWYGPGFAGHKTANGERFDPDHC